MPPKYLFDISGIDFNQILFDQEYIRSCIPQRGDMEHLNAIVWADGDAHRIIGYKDVRENEFWVPGHIPGRPLFPGVLMIEAAAQLCSFFVRKYEGWDGFIGFGGVNDCKFRQQVVPGQRLYLIAERIWERHSRFCSNVQGLVNDTIAFEAQIVGLQM